MWDCLQIFLLFKTRNHNRTVFVLIGAYYPFSEASRLLWCPNHGRHSPQSHLPQPLHPHRKCGQRPQCGLPQHGESGSTQPLSHVQGNPVRLCVCGCNPPSVGPPWHVSAQTGASTALMQSLRHVSGNLVCHKTVFSAVFQVRSNTTACIDVICSALLPPSFDHRLFDAKSLLAALLLSSFNNRGHGRVALLKVSLQSLHWVSLHALGMNFVNCLEVFFCFFPTFNQKSQKRQ